MNHEVNQSVVDTIQFNYNDIPLAVFLIGANGSGKSTLRNYLNLTDIQTNIDPDVLNRIFKIKYPQHYLMESAKQALTMYNQAIKNNLNICIESTLAGHGTMQRIIQGKKIGYHLVGYFVGLNDIELNLCRVHERVARGGHNIEEHLVRRRYIESINNLKQIWECFNTLHVLDNSGDSYKLQFSYANQKIINCSSQLEKWAATLFD